MISSGKINNKFIKMKEIILDVLKKMRTDYGNNENIIFAQDSDLEVVVDELLTAINYTRCCEELKGKKAMTFEEWVESEGYTEKWDGYFKNGIKSTYWIVKGKYVMYTNELNL